MKDIEAAGRVASLEDCMDFMFGEYSDLAWHKVAYFEKGKNFMYPALGLFVQTGAIAECIKGLVRNGYEGMDALTIEQVKLKLGEILWHVNALCGELGLKLSDVARDNLVKLYSRKGRGKLKGEGDNR